jgi:tRNA dimethylallyltransferase
LAQLVAELSALDPVHVEKMDTSNPQRVVRALEVCLASGQPFSSFHAPDAISERPFDVVELGLTAPRDVLEARIRQRLSKMIEAGWEAEARAALPHRDENALQTVGYREWFEHFDGKLTRAEAAEKIAVKTRQFAKRQMTWFQRQSGVVWFGHETCPELLHHAAEICVAENIPFTESVSSS